MEETLNSTLEYTPTWIVAVVCSIIVLVSLLVERALHRLGKFLVRKKQDALFEALQKLKEELMVLGFISLLLTVTQNFITDFCIPPHLASHMLPCKIPVSSNGSETKNHGQNSYEVIINRRRLLSAESSSGHCEKKGKVQLLSLEALHHLHIFIFVLAVVHVIFCVTTMVLGGARIRQWKKWEDSVRKEISRSSEDSTRATHIQNHHHHEFFKEHGEGYWRKASVVSWVISLFKQFYGSVTESDYIALRQGFIKEHCPNNPHFNFHEYVVRTLEVDFRRVVGISWYLWLFVVLFLLINLEGWNTYFWLAFLPLILLLLVGAKLEHIIARMAQESFDRRKEEHQERVKPSDEYFWFNRPSLVLDLIHFILFQNSFEIAFFFWIWSTYGFDSCIMENLAYIIPRLLMGVIVQVLCSYSTLPLYALVTQMGSKFKEGMFDKNVESTILTWAEERKSRTDKMTQDLSNNTAEQEVIMTKGTTASTIELSCVVHPPSP